MRYVKLQYLSQDPKENNDANEPTTIEPSNGAALQASDDEDNDQDEDLDEEDDDLEEADEWKGRDDPQQMSVEGQQISNSDPSSPPPAKKSRSELARFYEAAVTGRTLRSTAPGQAGQGNKFDSIQD